MEEPLWKKRREESMEMSIQVVEEIYQARESPIFRVHAFRYCSLHVRAFFRKILSSCGIDKEHGGSDSRMC